jgi:hypothetical protein
MNEHTPQLELWIQDIQSYLYKIIKEPMEQAGFKFDRTNYSFKRKLEKNTQEFGFLFINQFPVNYRINFILQIRNNEVREVKSSFSNHIETNNFKLSSLIMMMRDFYGETNSGTPRKDHIIFTNQDLFAAVEAINRILVDQAIPLCDELKTLDDLESFFANHPCWSVNSLSLDNVISELIIAKLTRRRDFDTLYQQLAEDVNKKIQQGEINSGTGEIFKSCYEFLLKKY